MGVIFMTFLHDPSSTQNKQPFQNYFLKDIAVFVGQFSQFFASKLINFDFIAIQTRTICRGGGGGVMMSATQFSPLLNFIVILYQICFYRKDTVLVLSLCKNNTSI